MISVVGRAINFAASLKATSQVVATSAKVLVSPTVQSKEDKSVVLKSPLALASTPLLYSGKLPSGTPKISSGICVSYQVRSAHTDIQVPSFDDVRRKSTLDPTSSPKESAVYRQGFTYLISGGAIIVGAYSAKAIVRHLVTSLSPSAAVLALAKVEIKIDVIPEGKSMTFKWRGKPVFVRHRTGEQIAAEQGVDVSSLRDPQHDSERVKDPKWLVLIGVCTHLGCVPIADAGDFGGYYCPCHGSHYDGSGRIRKGPAPLNLEVPDYSFEEGGMIVVG